MKVLFTFGGTTHYYNPILNKLNKIESIEVFTVVPKGNTHTLGGGVFQTHKGIEFNLYELREYRTWYGKHFFNGLTNLLEDIKPEILVLIWPYVLGLLFYPRFYRKIRKLRIKVIFKDIPFRLPKFQNAFLYYMNLSKSKRVNKELCIYQSYIFLIKSVFLTFLRKIYFNLVDAHVDYVEEAFELLDSYGVKQNKIFIIYNSPETDVLLKINEKIKSEEPILPPNNKRIIHVGRLVKWKRVDLLLEVFSKLKNRFPEAELLIIGTGPLEDELKVLSKKLNIKHSIKFLGGIYNPEILGKYLRSSSIYVLAGMGGLSINEAMCFERPIVCSVCDGTEKKLVIEGYNGRYFKEGDGQELYSVLEYLLERPETLEIMGQNSGNIIRNDINTQKVLDGYIKAFNYVTNNHYNLKCY